MKRKLIICFILLSVISRAQWQKISSYPSDGNILSLAFMDSNIFVGTTNILSLSKNDGLSWEQTLGAPYYGASALAVNYPNIFAGTWGGGFLLSTDTGKNWITPDSGFMNGTGINCMATSGTSIFIGTDKGVYLSTNNGIAWTPVNNGLGANSNMQTLVVNGTTIYAGSTNNGHGVFESTNNGANWTPIAPLYSFYPYAMAIIDTNIFAGCIFEGIYYSHNNGSNWIKVDSDLPDNITVYSMINIGTTVMAGTDSGVYISSNYGISWQEFNNGLGLYRGVTALGINDTTIYAGISGDLYKISSKILGIEQIEKNKEAINIYPNPSNGIFTLQFLGDVSPSLNSHNIVEVYNVLGEKVSSISSQVDENIINLSNQPNGVYLYRVVSENGDLAGEGKIVVQR